MAGSDKIKIPLKEGLWIDSGSPNENPQLIGSQCRNCGEVYFPKKEKRICINCQQRNLEEIKLSRRGKIYSFTIVMQRPPIYYKASVPYALAWVELPEGVRLETLLTDCTFDDLLVGMDVELVIEMLFQDEEGNDIVTYKFKPISNAVERKARYK